MKIRMFFLPLLFAIVVGCAGPPPEAPEEIHSPRLAIAQNSKGEVTMSWVSDSHYLYTIYYQDHLHEKWKELRSVRRVRGTGGPMGARDRVNPRNPVMRRYWLYFEKPGETRAF